MSALPPSDAPAVFVVDGGQQAGPITIDALVDSIRSGQRDTSTMVWWDGVAEWFPFNSHPGLTGLLGGGSEPPAPVPPPPSASPMQTEVPVQAEAPVQAAAPASMGPETDDELESVFTEMVHASWRYFKRVDFATTLDEVLLGALITSSLSTGQVLIDLTSDGTNHYVRFENPNDGSRSTMAITHLTPDAVKGEVLGHHASVVIGWGQRVANAGNVVNALKQEWKSGLVQTPEPGTVTVDGDLTSGYAYTQIDLIWALEDYVSSDYTVNADKLTLHVRAALHSLRKYWYGRFTPAGS